jgi:hypothetical protein
VISVVGDSSCRSVWRLHAKQIGRASLLQNRIRMLGDKFNASNYTTIRNTTSKNVEK